MNKRERELVKECLYLMDEKGGCNPEDNAGVLFDEYWNRLRTNLLDLLDGGEQSRIAINAMEDNLSSIPAHPIIIMPEKWI